MKASASLVLFSSIVGCGSRATPPRVEAVAAQIGRDALLSAKIRCAEQGWKYNKGNSVREKGAVQIGQRFAYNEKLNTCIYWDGALTSDGFKYESIIDILENVVLIEHYGSTDRAKSDKESIRSEREFTMVRKKLFSESELRLGLAIADEIPPATRLVK